MPAILICTHGGEVLVNAFPDDAIPQEMLADAQPASSLEEAASMVQDVLGDTADGQQPPEGAGPEQHEATDPDRAEADMQTGFNRAKKGY